MRKKKKICRTWMGYCPFEHKAGLGTALGAQGHSWAPRQALGHRRWGVWRRLGVRAGAGRADRRWHGRRRSVLGRAGRWGARRHAGGVYGRRARERGACGRGARGPRRQASGALGTRALGGTGERQAGTGRGRARGLGMLLGQWAVHSVHSACFWPGLTQYGS